MAVSSRWSLGILLVLSFLPQHPVSAVSGSQDQEPKTTTDRSDDPIQIVSEAVVLDFVARDREGDAITDLKPDEIQVFEEGLEQEILSLSCRQPESPGESEGEVDQPDPHELDTLAPPNVERSEDINLVSIVLHGLSPGGRFLAQRAALDFVGEALPPDTYLAVFRIDRTLRPVIGFTRDLEKITVAINAAVGGTYEGLADSTEAILATPPSAGGGSASSSEQDGALARILDFSERVRTFSQSQLIIDSLLSLVLGQQTLDGRKTVLLFSEGMFIPQRLVSRFESMISQANLNNVSFYSIDARGVSTAPQLGGVASELSGAAGSTASQVGSVGGGISAADMMALENAANAIRADVQGPLLRIAEQTGGFFSANNNPDREMRQIRSDLVNYCQVAYRPQGLGYDGSFREVKLKVTRPGVKIVSRKGYFALPPTPDGELRAFEVPLFRTLMTGQKVKELPGDYRLQHYGVVGDRLEGILILRAPLKAFEIVRRNEQINLHFSVLALIKDTSGRIVQKLSQDYPLSASKEQLDSFKKGEMFFLRRFELAPGKYSFEAVLTDQLKNRNFRERAQFVLPQQESSFSISSVSVIDRIEPLSDRPEDQTNPLRYGRSKIIPNLGQPIHKSKVGQIGFHCVLYPVSDSTDEPALVLAFVSNGRVVYQGVPLVPSPNSRGNIPVISTLPMELFEPGQYEVWAIAQQGNAISDEFTTFEIVP